MIISNMLILKICFLLSQLKIELCSLILPLIFITNAAYRCLYVTKATLHRHRLNLLPSKCYTIASHIIFNYLEDTAQTSGISSSANLPYHSFVTSIQTSTTEAISSN